MDKALFLDRDGIIIKDISYPHNIEDLYINSDIIPNLKWAMEAGFKLIIITNQAGIAKGRFTLDQYNKFQTELIFRLKSLGVNITATYFCPYHKDGIITPYNIESNDRKPKPGMVLKAVKEHDLDIKQSYMIGDKLSDNIEIDELKCFILKSEYNKGSIGTYNTIDDIFKELKRGIQ